MNLSTFITLQTFQLIKQPFYNPTIMSNCFVKLLWKAFSCIFKPRYLTYSLHITHQNYQSPPKPGHLQIYCKIRDWIRKEWLKITIQCKIELMALESNVNMIDTIKWDWSWLIDTYEWLFKMVLFFKSTFKKFYFLMDHKKRDHCKKKLEYIY